MRIKVCGNTQLQQVYALDEIGVNLAGFIFYPKSPRYVVDKINARQLKKAKLNISKVGVFVNENYDDVMNYVEQYGLDMVQLHGDETPEYCEKMRLQIYTIKVFSVKNGDNINRKIWEYKTVSDLFLFDTYTPIYGGSGKKFDWEIIKQVMVDKPFLLSGGISINDVEDIKALAATKLYADIFAVDINSKFEISPGIKDIAMIKTFAEALQ
jgi:phosphoribosylanthranilate isomerase